MWKRCYVFGFLYQLCAFLIDGDNRQIICVLSLVQCFNCDISCASKLWQLYCTVILYGMV